MANFLRFGERKNKFGVTQMMCCTDGEYVKFADIAELFQTAHNKQSTPLYTTWHYCPDCGKKLSNEQYCDHK